MDSDIKLLTNDDSSERTDESLSTSQEDASQFDAQTFDEWTIITPEDSREYDCHEESDNNLIEDKDDSETNDDETIRNDVTNETNDETKGDTQIDETTKKSVENVQNVRKDTEVNTENDSHSQSDIDIINESSDDDEASLCSSSVISQMSNFSFLRDYYMNTQRLNTDSIHEDLSESSSLMYKDELRPDMELKPGVRAYVHTPNTKLNVRLNLLLALVVTAVIGLGVGNFLGWSTLKSKHMQLSMGQVMKLKQLQDELVMCMQNQDKSDDSPNLMTQNAGICYGNSDYWKEKFKVLFSENGGLMEVLQKTQQHYHLKGNHENILTDKECDNASASEEFHKLKLNVLVKQMEHLHLLKTLEEVTFKGKQNEKRVHVLEAENSELKMKLVEEEEDDKVIVESWENRVQQLVNENNELRTLLEEDEDMDSIILEKLMNQINELQYENRELRTALTQLENQIEMVGQTSVIIDNNDNKVILNEYSSAAPSEKKSDAKFVNVPLKIESLKQSINQMVAENDELKSTIARLRWSSQAQEAIVEDEEEEDDVIYPDIIALEEQLTNLRNSLLTEQNEAKKWKQMYEEISQRSSNGQNRVNIFTDWFENFTYIIKEGMLSGTLGDHLNNVLEKISEGGTLISDEITNRINATQEVVTDLNRRLLEKWNQLDYIRGDVNGRSQKLTSQMVKVIESTLSKLQEAITKFAKLKNEKPFESRVKHFMTKINKLTENMDERWNELITKWSKRYQSTENANANHAKVQSDTNWVFARANARRNNDINPKDNWIFERARDREAQRVDVDTQKGDEENWFLRREKKLRVNDDYKTNSKKKSKNADDDDADDENSEVEDSFVKASHNRLRYVSRKR